jgi:hypothetical protein
MVGREVFPVSLCQEPANQPDPAEFMKTPIEPITSGGLISVAA